MRVTERIDLPVDPDRAWRAAIDPRVIRRTMPGLEVFEVLGGGPLRRGTRLRTVLRVGAAELGSELEVTELVEGRDIVATGVTGIDLHVGIRVRPHDDGARIVIRLGYNPPGGVPGALAGVIALPEMRRRTREMLRALGRQLLDEPEPRRLPNPLRVASTTARSAHVFARAGVFRPMRPDKYLTIARQLGRWGATPAGAYSAAAVRDPQRLAIVDGERALTYAELDARSTALAVALRDRGVGEGHRVALAARNHRGFVEALIAVSKAGADALLMNTGLAAPQVRAVMDRERPTAVICDADLLELIDEARGATPATLTRVVSAWDDDHRPRSGVRSIDELIVEGAGRGLRYPGAPGRVVLLTSGTTGPPKGSRRSRIPVDAPVALLDRLPYRDGSTFLVAPPLFHAWGYVNLLMALLLGSTVVLQREFDPEEALRGIARHGVDVLIAVPVMLQRILDLDPELRATYDLSSLTTVASSGSALKGNLALRWMDAFGDGLHNLYGSTEVGWAAIADPEDLRSAPGTAGRIPLGATVRIYDDADVPLPTHRPGRIHVGGANVNDRYTDGTRLTRVDGLTETGDVGYLDDLGRLFVLGREDDMIVSAGENVYPRGIEDLLIDHPEIDEVAAVGVADAELGQRLAVHVVLHEGSTLDADGVRAYVGAQRARVDVPRDVHFHDALPRGATGKILRRELAAASAEG
ncbi:Long-chain-fatty-acid--CoA ligase [Patulibacter medicamentivorans]|uniref:Long-chain-fatty-acid--CoA ligase n=1 Tax=Patulibacter medicamentivorans TaxID=1097667 RepID=H0E972_9ACTN|nr:AMP-binding protein [Patulibacter medicamentivorans]EHN09778.1 Long-chain-fatty-acid--CoA ligase [Patulibacter medicamentivorans]